MIDQFCASVERFEISKRLRRVRSVCRRLAASRVVWIVVIALAASAAMVSDAVMKPQRNMPVKAGQAQDESRDARTQGALPPRWCWEVLRARREFNPADGAQQREARAIFEEALADWHAEARPLNDALVDESRALWRAGDFASALDRFAAAFPCE